MSTGEDVSSTEQQQQSLSAANNTRLCVTAGRSLALTSTSHSDTQITDHRSQSRNEYLIFTLLLLLLMTFIGRKLRHTANAPSQPLHNNSYPRTGTFSESTIP